MVDEKPPRLASGERETLVALLAYQRTSVVKKVTGIDELRASWSPVGSGTSLRWLVEHLARAESSWVEQRFAGHDVDERAAPATLAAALDEYRATWARVDAIVAAAGLDDECAADAATPPVNLRWVLAHLLEETARHAGHADVLRELVDGETGR